MFYQWIYKKVYLKTLLFLADVLRIPKKPATEKGSTQPKSDPTFDTQNKDPIFDAKDKKATLLGDSYRGIGVAVSVLGLLIIFCAIAPIALEIEHQFGDIFIVCEIVLMLLMLFLVRHTTKKDLRKNWIDARKEVETLRYADLNSKINQLETNDNGNKDFDNDMKKALLTALNQKLHHIFDEQVNYNKDKAEIYLRIEKSSDILSWVGFVLAFTAVCAHLFTHAPFLLFFTAFIPALVGAIHGTNAFLRLSDLAEDHIEMAKGLEEAQGSLNDKGVDSSKMLEIAEKTYNMLTDRDTKWAAKTNKLGLKLV